MEPWVKVGAEVASVCIGQHKSVTFSKIDRIGKMWLFLENGEKFHNLGLDRNEGGPVGSRTYRLLPADHERVSQIQMDIEVRKVMKGAVKAAEEFAKEPSVENAKKTILCLLPFTPWDLIQSNQQEPKKP